MHIKRESDSKKEFPYSAQSDWTPSPQNLISKSPYCLPYNSYHLCSENLVLDQLIIPLLLFFCSLVMCLLDVVLLLYGEILSWSLIEVKGLKVYLGLHLGSLVHLNLVGSKESSCFGAVLQNWECQLDCFWYKMLQIRAKFTRKLPLI